MLIKKEVTAKKSALRRQNGRLTKYNKYNKY